VQLQPTIDTAVPGAPDVRESSRRGLLPRVHAVEEADATGRAGLGLLWLVGMWPPASE
jgi:hypothetical protein